MEMHLEIRARKRRKKRDGPVTKRRPTKKEPSALRQNKKYNSRKESYEVNHEESTSGRDYDGQTDTLES